MLPAYLHIAPEAMPSIALAAAWFALLRGARSSRWRVALLSIAGTIGHEMMHAAVGWALNAKPVSFSIFPRRNGDTWILGSVTFMNLNIWNSAPVAFAPLLLAGVGLITFQEWMLPSFLVGSYGTWLLSGHVVACCLFACLPSPDDIRIGALSGFMYGALGYGLWLAAQ